MARQHTFLKCRDTGQKSPGMRALSETQGGISQVSYVDAQIRCAGPVNPDDEQSTCIRCVRLSLMCSWTTHRAGRTRNVQVPRLGPDRASISEVTAVTAPRSDTNPDDRELYTNVNRELVTTVRSITSNDELCDKAELQQILRTYFGTVHCESNC